MLGIRRWWHRRRLRSLEHRLAEWEAAGKPLIILPPLPPCDHLDTVTFPDPFRGVGVVTVCAYCNQALESSR